jgi:hypothetical protein
MRESKTILKPGPATLFVTTPTRDHLPIFSIDELAAQAVLQLGRAAGEFDAAIVGYCVAPWAAYAVLHFNGEYDLPGFMYHYKWLTSHAILGLDHGEFHERLFRRGKFKPWMNRFDQLAISTGEQLRSKLDYVHNEPVRLGLVKRPEDWKFSSARDWIHSTKGLIEITKDACNTLSITELD